MKPKVQVACFGIGHDSIDAGSLITARATDTAGRVVVDVSSLGGHPLDLGDIRHDSTD